MRTYDANIRQRFRFQNVPRTVTQCPYNVQQPVHTAAKIFAAQNLKKPGAANLFAAVSIPALPVRCLDRADRGDMVLPGADIEERLQ
jgi:hypothetical protein